MRRRNRPILRAIVILLFMGIAFKLGEQVAYHNMNYDEDIGAIVVDDEQDDEFSTSGSDSWLTNSSSNSSDSNSFSTTNTSGTDPEEVAMQYCKGVIADIKTEISEDTQETMDGGVYIAGIMSPVLTNGIDSIKYSKGYATVEGNKASVAVFVDYPDYSSILKYTMFDFWDETNAKEYELDDGVELFKSLLNKNMENLWAGTGYSTVNLELTKDANGIWSVSNSDDAEVQETLLKVGYSGTDEMVYEPDNLVQEYLKYN